MPRRAGFCSMRLKMVVEPLGDGNAPAFFAAITKTSWTTTGAAAGFNRLALTVAILPPVVGRATGEAPPQPTTARGIWEGRGTVSFQHIFPCDIVRRHPRGSPGAARAALRARTRNAETRAHALPANPRTPPLPALSLISRRAPPERPSISRKSYSKKELRERQRLPHP